MNHTQRSNVIIRLLTVLALVAVSTGVLHADPIQNARKLIEQGQSGQVDRALGELLAQSPPPREALELSMQAAMAEGRFVTAERRVEQILEHTDKPDAKLVHTAAQLAQLTGQTTREAEMLALYTRLAPQKSQTLQLALMRLMEIGNNANAFTLYVKLYGGQEPFVLRRGIQLLDRLYENGQAADYATLADALLGLTGDRPELSSQVTEKLYEVCERGLFMNTPGKPLDGSGKVSASSAEGYRKYSQGAAIVMRHPIHNTWRAWEMIKRSGQVTSPVIVAFGDKASGPFSDQQVREMRHGQYWGDLDKVPADLAKRILAWESRYEAKTDPRWHKEYANWVAGTPQLFGKSADLNRVMRIVDAVNRRYADQPHEMNDVVTGLFGWCKTSAQLEQVVRKYPGSVNFWNLRNPIDRMMRDEPAGKKLALFGKLTAGDPAAGQAVLDWMRQAGQHKQALEAAKQAMLALPGNMDINRIKNDVIYNDDLSPQDRVDLLDAVYQKAGYSKPLAQLVNEASKHKTLAKSNELKNFKKSLDKDKTGSDPICTAHARLFMAQNRTEKPLDSQVHQSVTAALRAYRAKFPAGRPGDAALQQVLAQYGELCNKNNKAGRADSAQYVQVVLGHLSARGPWDQLSGRADHSGEADLCLKVVQACLAERGPINELSSGCLYRMANATQGDPYILSAHYGKMSPYSAWTAIRGATEWTKQYAAGLEQVTKLLKAHKQIDENTLRTIIHDTDRNWLRGVEANQVPADLLAELGERVIKPRRDFALYQAFNFFNHAGKLDQAVALYLTGVDRMPKTEQFQLRMNLFNMVGDDRRPALLEELYTLAQALSPVERQQVMLASVAFHYLESAIIQRRAPEEVRERLADMPRKMLDLIAAGLPISDVGYQMSQPLAAAVKRHLEQGRMDMALKMSQMLMRTRRSQEMRQVLSLLRDRGQWELLYLTADRVDDQDQQLHAFAQQQRGIAAAKIPGLYPVGPEHPAYPLYVASGELLRGNEQLAWEMLRDNTEPFFENPLRFDTDFVVWSLDKLRQVRGSNDALIDKARQLCDQIIAREADLETSFIAHITLLRANIFRDLGRLEAAELEYKTLLSNPGFQKTEPGRLARYRLVELMITRGNLPGAAERIETWLAFPDPKLHTQAYYFKAKMAFENEDYKVCRDMLNQVFEREYGHEQARLLEGEWRKQTKALEDTDVYAGRRVELSLITPGEELKLSIHDKNLSVIGEGSSIPVVVTTEPGNDRETVRLYPAPRTKNLFRSLVSTQLGDADPGNLVIDLTGKDTIRYEIDPVYLQERGLEGMGARTLRVVDDAWMSASAGRLLTEAEQKDLALKRQVAAIRGERLEKQGSRRTVRPGNPLYVMVRDRDRDISAEADSIEINLQTSSGDQLGGAKLIETAPHSGMFRSAVPTAFPLPRAYASDSAEGKDPSTLINSSKPGLWSTKPDAGKGKWVEVDTMSGHAIKQASLNMPEVKAISRLDLYGSYQGQEIRLGRYPESANGEAKGGLAMIMRQQSYQRMERADLQTIRGALRGSEMLEPTGLNQPAITLKKQSQMVGHLSGTFFLDKELNTRFTMTGERLAQTVYLLIDGDVVMGGDARRLAESTYPYFLSAGAHRMEVYFWARNNNRDFSIAIQDENEPAKAIPARWFSVKDNPGLAEFLQDRAKIVRTADGFTANFDEPTRLRKLRWQFTEYTGASVTAGSITLTDADGKTVLPVTHDFTTGLKNDRLEIAPGDQVTITYRDTRNNEMQPRVLSDRLDAGYANGDVVFQYELDAGIGMPSEYSPAYRFKPGEQLTVIVRDPDADLSDKADTVDLLVRTAGGNERKLKAIEKRLKPSPTMGEESVHSDTFVAILKTSLQTTDDPDTIQVHSNDRLQAFYLDKENTNPGVPTIRRSETLPAVRPIPTKATFYRAIRYQEPNRRDPKKMHERMRFEPLDAPAEGESEVIDAAAPLKFELYAPSRALHGRSTVTAIVTTDSEAETAKAENREPQQWTVQMKVAGGTDAEPHSIFQQDLDMKMGTAMDNLAEAAILARQDREKADGNLLSGPLPVLGADTVHITLLDEQNKPFIKRRFKLATDGTLDLFDKNYEKPDHEVHMGEKFYVQVVDPDQDTSPEHDEITVTIQSPKLTEVVPLNLTETLPHSGIFNGSVRTLFDDKAAPDKTADDPPAPKDKTDLTVGIPVGYGQELSFAYDEQMTSPATKPGKRTVTGKVLLGADGAVDLFSKRYRDRETGARVQFRLAECLFEMAKEYRKVNNTELAADAISRGRQILEEAMQDYPDTSLVIEGTYLLANLHQELAAEQMAQKNRKEALKLYQQAVARFSSIISTWPDSPFAARSQFHKAMCLEKIGDEKRASEEYVRLCYAYPDSPLVADATVRLATHFYRQGRYDVSGRIYENFARNYASHPKAPKVMFMAAQSHMKQAQTWQELVDNPDEAKADPHLSGRGAQDISASIAREYRTAAKALDYLVTEMKDAAGANLRAQAMYWCGVAYRKAQDLPTAYLRIKRVTFEYPDTKWARMARGMLLQDDKLAKQADVK